MPTRPIASVLTFSVLVAFASPACYLEADEPSSHDDASTCCKCDAPEADFRGDFVGAGDREVRGEAAFITTANTGELALSEDFETPSGPGLYVYLSPTPEIGEGAIELAPLEAFSGAQRYTAPEGVTPESHPYAVIYCVPFSVVFGHARLASSPDEVSPALEARGMFAGRGERILRGEAVLTDVSGELQVAFTEPFETPSGPGLYVYLSPPPEIGEGAVELAPLEAFSGAQRYTAPEGVTAESHPYAVIYCLPFSVVFGLAELEMVVSTPGERVHGVEEGSERAQRIIEFVNMATFETLDQHVPLDRRAAQGIVDRRPFASLNSLDSVPYVAQAAFGRLDEFVNFGE